VSAALVEQHVWAYMQAVLSDPALLRARYEESRGDPAVEGREERERQRLERQVHAMEREVQRLIDAYQVGAIDLAELQERRRRSAEHQQVLRQRLGELQHQRQERAQELRLLQGLDGFCTSIRSEAKSATTGCRSYYCRGHSAGHPSHRPHRACSIATTTSFLQKLSLTYDTHNLC
jgi:hypothetical protein